MEAYGASLGLTNTHINHNIGCGTPHNVTTLVDLGKVYESYQNGTITTSSTWKTQFRSRMLNETNFVSNGVNRYQAAICPIVQQEATSLGKSAATATAFCNALKWISKGGSYGYGDSTVSWDSVSLTAVPYKVSGTITPKNLIFGQYVDGTNIGSATEQTNVQNAQSKLYQEAMRPYIHAALATW
jgi:hypothetical protein